MLPRGFTDDLEDEQNQRTFPVFPRDASVDGDLLSSEEEEPEASEASDSDASELSDHWMEPKRHRESMPSTDLLKGEKRKPGRPRKVQNIPGSDAGTVLQKRKRGRPKKIHASDPGEVLPKRKPGRPRKSESNLNKVTASSVVKRKPGRPRKDAGTPNAPQSVAQNGAGNGAEVKNRTSPGLRGKEKPVDVGSGKGDDSVAATPAKKLRTAATPDPPSPLLWASLAPGWSLRPPPPSPPYPPANGASSPTRGPTQQSHGVGLGGDAHSDCGGAAGASSSAALAAPASANCHSATSPLIGGVKRGRGRPRKNAAASLAAANRGSTGAASSPIENQLSALPSHSVAPATSPATDVSAAGSSSSNGAVSLNTPRSSCGDAMARDSRVDGVDDESADSGPVSFYVFTASGQKKVSKRGSDRDPNNSSLLPPSTPSRSPTGDA